MESPDADLQGLDGFFHIEGESIQYTPATYSGNNCLTLRT
jgi:hypothetical protein